MVAKETNFLKIFCTGIDKYENEYENENENMKTKKFSLFGNRKSGELQYLQSFLIRNLSGHVLSSFISFAHFFD